MVPFAGWEMPVHYGSILDEVRAVRGGVGVFDVSHMGEFRVAGDDALAALQHLLTNDASRLRPGRAQYTLLCREDGGVLDDLIVYRNDHDFLVVANASNRADDFQWMTGHTAALDARWTDESDATALLAVQGPRAAALLAPLVSGVSLAELRPFSHGPAVLQTAGGQIEARLARTGYTGEDGFEIFCAWDDAPAIWNAVTAAGAAPCGLGARDVLRIEAAYPLYGHEINVDTNPYAAGLGWVVKPDKGPFIGRDAIVSARDAGLPRQLRGLLPEDPRAIPREGAEVVHRSGVGRVTSGTFSPTLGRAIAMAYMPAGAAGEAQVLMRGRQLPAAIVDLPFYKKPAASAG
jgi:aminomethyltransferase